MVAKHESVDRVFDSGHEKCKGGQVSLVVCGDIAVMLADLVHRQTHELESHGADVEVVYFMKALEADLLTQVESQLSDLDAELEAITS